MKKRNYHHARSLQEKILIGAVFFLVLGIIGALSLVLPPAEPVFAANDFNLDQCLNTVNNKPFGQCQWGTGNVSNGVSEYNEGAAVGQRFGVGNYLCNTASCELHFSSAFAANASGFTYHGIDFFVKPPDFDPLSQKYNGFAEDINLCDNATFFPGCATAVANGTFVDIPYPADPWQSTCVGGWGCHVQDVIDGYTRTMGTNNTGFRLYYNATQQGATPPTVTLTLGHTGIDTNNNPEPRTQFTLTLTGMNNGVDWALYGGAHLALSGNHAFDPQAWGGLEGAYPIGNSSWHVYLDSCTFTSNCSTGNKANQMSLRGGAPNPLDSNAVNHVVTVNGVVTVTDYITVTDTATSNQNMAGTVQWYVCYAYPANASHLSAGCKYTSTGTTIVDSGYITVTKVKTPVTLTSGNPATGSQTYNPTAYGTYCFSTFYQPTVNASGYFVSSPTTDNNQGNTAPECFALTPPTSVDLSSFRASSINDIPILSNGFVAVSILGLAILGLITSGVVFYKYKVSRNQS